MHKRRWLLWCIAAFAALGSTAVRARPDPARREARALAQSGRNTGNDHTALALAIRSVVLRDAPPPPTEWLAPADPAGANSPAAIHPGDNGWGVPAGWLRGLGSLQSARLSLGSLSLRRGTVAFRIAGRLRITANYPLLDGRVEMQMGRRRVAFTVPAVQVAPPRQGGLFGVEVIVLLFDRRF